MFANIMLCLFVHIQRMALTFVQEEDVAAAFQGRKVTRIEKVFLLRK